MAAPEHVFYYNILTVSYRQRRARYAKCNEHIDEFAENATKNLFAAATGVCGEYVRELLLLLLGVINVVRLMTRLMRRVGDLWKHGDRADFATVTEALTSDDKTFPTWLVSTYDIHARLDGTYYIVYEPKCERTRATPLTMMNSRRRFLDPTGPTGK